MGISTIFRHWMKKKCLAAEAFSEPLSILQFFHPPELDIPILVLLPPVFHFLREVRVVRIFCLFGNSSGSSRLLLLLGGGGGGKAFYLG